jgi:hypothetical protein
MLLPDSGDILPFKVLNNYDDVLYEKLEKTLFYSISLLQFELMKELEYDLRLSINSELFN